MVKIYHYTTKDSGKSIYASRTIRANAGAYGYGVYFTALPPSTDTKTLILNNYDDGTRILNDPAFVNKTKVWIAFDSNAIAAYKVSPNQNDDRDIWLAPNDVTL